MEYLIHEGNIPRLERKLKRIEGRCKKNDLPFSYTLGAESFREIQREASDGSKYCTTERFLVVEVQGNTSIAGWKFVASILHEKHGNLLNAISDEDIPLEYRNTAPYCDHCKSQRIRKQTYLVRNVESGEYKQAGRSCLADFIGGLSAEDYASYLSIYDELYEMDGEFVKKWEDSYVPVLAFVACVAYVMERDNGYHKQNESKSTLLEARQAMTKALWKVEQRHYDRAEKAISWAKNDLVADNRNIINNMDGRNLTYEGNLAWCAYREYCNVKAVGILASIIVAHDRFLQREREETERNEQRAISKYVGEIGEKITLEDATGYFITSYENGYGHETWTHVYKFVKDGNVFIWFSSSCQSIEKKGTTVTVRGTIKTHNERDGEKQTILTRCKIA